MRRNSGKDEGRNLFLDPTMRDRERERGRSGAAVLTRDANEGAIDNNRNQRTTGMGSHARKTDQKGKKG